MKIVHSKIIGEGAPLLILHGYFGMSDNWKSLGNKFGEDFQIHLIDQRNHGRSFHAGNFDYDLLVEDIVQYIKHHQLEKVIVLGHSMGGKAAMLFAVKYPTLVAKLIIVDIAPRYYQPHHTDILKALNSVDFLIHNTRKLVDQKIAELIPDIGVRSFLLKNAISRQNRLGFRLLSRMQRVHSRWSVQTIGPIFSPKELRQSYLWQQSQTIWIFLKERLSL